MTIPMTVIPDVPEGTLDPAAGLNLSLNPLRALVQAVVSQVGVNSPPGSPADGECVIVGAGSGAFSGQDGNLARYVQEGDTWLFYEAGVAVNCVLNLADMGLYVHSSSSSGGWEPYPSLSSLQDAANDGAAASAGVEVGGLYRNGSALMIRVS